MEHNIRITDRASELQYCKTVAKNLQRIKLDIHLLSTLRAAQLITNLGKNLLYGVWINLHACPQYSRIILLSEESNLSFASHFDHPILVFGPIDTNKAGNGKNVYLGILFLPDIYEEVDPQRIACHVGALDHINMELFCHI
jgi:hypothetical protein